MPAKSGTDPLTRASLHNILATCRRALRAALVSRNPAQQTWCYPQGKYLRRVAAAAAATNSLALQTRTASSTVPRACMAPSISCKPFWGCHATVMQAIGRATCIESFCGSGPPQHG